LLVLIDLTKRKEEKTDNKNTKAKTKKLTPQNIVLRFNIVSVQRSHFKTL